MDETKYSYRINSIHLKNGEPFSPGRINVFVGANNCGKTQLLKDMIAYITGSQTPTIVLDELEILYPDTWDDMAKAYGMKIEEINGNQRLRHVSPTFDSEPKEFSAHNISSLLPNWLKSDRQTFRLATGAGMVTYLNTDNRLRLAVSQTVQPNLQQRGARNVLESLYVSGEASTAVVKKCIQKIFGLDIYLNSYNLGTLEFKIGEDFSSVSSNPQEAFRQLSAYPLLDTQGDGIRSVLGMISALLSAKKPICLLDEPEAFLHPPQAIQLGEIISELVGANQQVFISTHSADFLRGLLASTRESVIIHLSRTQNKTEASVLDSDMLNRIVTNPLLSSSRVLEGMFYKGVVATEADADSVFYQRAFQKIGAADEIHFVNAHNKQTLKKLIDPYKKLKIKFAMIADADVIRDKHDFLDILQIAEDEQHIRQILEDREAIMQFFQNKSKYELLRNLQLKTKELAEKVPVHENDTPEKIESALFDFRNQLKKLREDADELHEFKKSGREALPEPLQVKFDSLWNNCANIGLFIVNVGELESWMTDYGIERLSNKSKWIEQALDKMLEIEYDKDKAIWKFIDALKNYFN